MDGFAAAESCQVPAGELQHHRSLLPLEGPSRVPGAVIAIVTHVYFWSPHLECTDRWFGTRRMALHRLGGRVTSAEHSVVTESSPSCVPGIRRCLPAAWCPEELRPPLPVGNYCRPLPAGFCGDLPNRGVSLPAGRSPAAGPASAAICRTHLAF